MNRRPGAALRRGAFTAVIPTSAMPRADRKTARACRFPPSSWPTLSRPPEHRVITMDLHAAQIQGFFDIPVDHLYAAPIMLDYVRKKKLSNLVVVAPDVGGVERARPSASA